MYSCVTDEVTNLPVCTVDAAEVVPFHEALAQASNYLETHHLAPGVAVYRYRRDYLPDMITGNDVVALSRLAQEAAARGLTMAPELSALLPVGPRETVTAQEVEYVAASAGGLIAVVQTTYASIVAWDLGQRKPVPWAFVAAFGLTAAATTAAVLSKKGA